MLFVVLLRTNLGPDLTGLQPVDTHFGRKDAIINEQNKITVRVFFDVLDLDEVWEIMVKLVIKPQVISMSFVYPTMSCDVLPVYELVKVLKPPLFCVIFFFADTLATYHTCVENGALHALSMLPMAQLASIGLLYY